MGICESATKRSSRDGGRPYEIQKSRVTKSGERGEPERQRRKKDASNKENWIAWSGKKTGRTWITRERKSSSHGYGEEEEPRDREPASREQRRKTEAKLVDAEEAREKRWCKCARGLLCSDARSNGVPVPCLFHTYTRFIIRTLFRGRVHSACARLFGMTKGADERYRAAAKKLTTRRYRAIRTYCAG